MFRFPFGTTQELNLDWFLEQWEVFKQEAQTAIDGIDHALDDEIQRVEDAMTDLYAARDAAIAARDAAIAAKNNALDYAQSANGSAIGASQSAQNSAESAVTSAQQAQSAAQSATNAGTSAGNALTRAQQSEAWATGEIGGVDVPPTAPQYQNNAEYYAEQAAGSERMSANYAQSAESAVGQAQLHALTAEGYANGTRNGTPVEESSPFYHANAKYYAESIAGDAAAAAQSALDAEASVESVSQSAAQIAENTADIEDLKSSIVNQIGINENVSPKFEQGFWGSQTSTTRQDYIRTKDRISVSQNDIISVDMNGFVGTEVQFNWYVANDTYSDRTTVRKANWTDGVAYAVAPADMSYVRINIYSGGSTIYINPSDYDNVQIWKNPIPTVNDRFSSINEQNFIPFEVGLITITSGGWYFPNEQTNKRIRTIINTTLSLKVGDKICIAPFSGIRMYIGYQKTDGTYGMDGWLTSDYTVLYDGFYVVQAAYSTDRVITDFESIATSVWIEKTYARYSDFVQTNISNQIANRKNFSIANYNTKSINHRGWYLAPENTLPAFAQSKYYGFDYIETDIRATSDGVLVCLHDDTIDRTSNGRGNIANLTYAEVSEYDFGSWKNSAYTDTKIPTLTELLVLCKSIGLHPYIEVKDVLTAEQIAEVVSTVLDNGMTGEVTYLGTASILGAISQLDNKARLGLLLFGDISDSDVTAINTLKTAGNEVFFDVTISYLTSEGISKAKTAKVPVECWNVSPTDVPTINQYVSGYTTDTIVVTEELAKTQWQKYIPVNLLQS